MGASACVLTCTPGRWSSQCLVFNCAYQHTYANAGATRTAHAEEVAALMALLALQ